MKILSAKQLHEADKQTTLKQNISSLDLMERAGEQIYNWLHQRMQGAQVPIHIFCGIGNNGGDGLVLGRYLVNSGYNVQIYIANFTDKRSKCFLINYDRFKESTKKWPVLMTSKEDFPVFQSDDIIIDALFGIGLNRPPEGWVKDLILTINSSKAFKLSIDIPSGLHANQPIEDKDAIIKANHVLSFQTPKLSFFLPETGVFVPYFEVLDIGLDKEYLNELTPLAQLIGKAEAKVFYKPRERFTHKDTYGHGLIISGSYGQIGAAILSTRAMMNVGAGMATTFVPKCGYEILQTTIYEAMVLTDENENHITDIKYEFEPSVAVVGMGIGTAKETSQALKKFLKESTLPLVLDADAINCLSATKSMQKLIPKRTVLTPHPRELKRLIGEWKNDYEKLDKTKAFSKKHDVIIVLKGFFTIVVFEDNLYINTTGNPGMATAGSGDVLSGMIGGLISQGYDSLLASVLGVYLHGSAGDLAMQQLGYEAMLAGDIVNFISDAYIELFKEDSKVEKPKT